MISTVYNEVSIKLFSSIIYNPSNVNTLYLFDMTMGNSDTKILSPFWLVVTVNIYYLFGTNKFGTT